MSALRALIVDGDEGFSDQLRGWLSAYGLEVVVSPEWNDGLDTVEPALTFIAVELPDKAGFALCSRARELWRGAPIVVTTATVPQDELELHQKSESGAQAYLHKRTLTREDLLISLDALLGPARAEPAALEPDATEEGSTLRVAELEEEVRRLRWELDQTYLAAQSAPYSRDFLRLAEVVGSKEKEIVRLKKEIWARDHKIATSHRSEREALARALVATRERAAAAGHAAQLQRDLEAEQAEVRRFRADLQRQSAEVVQAIASLADERQIHEETRRGHEIAAVAHTEVLRQVTEEQLRTRAALEAQLREEKDQAIVALSTSWRSKLKTLRRRRDHSLAILHDRIRSLELAHAQELAGRSADHEAGLRQVAEEMAAARAEADRLRREEVLGVRAAAESQREELQRLHETTLAAALAAHADAEARLERQREAQVATEARLRTESAEAVDAAAAEWERKLEDLRRAHADSVGTLRRHFQDQLGALQATQEREQAKRDGEAEAALGRAAEDLVAVRAQAARLEVETRQSHEQELAGVQARELEALAALEGRLRGERDQALVASVSEWEARLDAVRRAHADSGDALRREHRNQLAALQASAAEELAAARAQATWLEQEVRKGSDLELARVQAAHVQALTILESRLRREKDKDIASALAAFEEKLEELRHGHAGSLDALREQYRDEITSLRVSSEQGASERDAAHHATLALTHTAHVEAETRIEERLREEQARAVAEAVTRWELKLDELRAAHGDSVAALRQHHREQLDAFQASGAQALAQRDVEHQAALHRAAEELAAARLHAARLDLEARQLHEQELVRAESGHLEVLRGLDARLREERDQAVAAAVATWQEMLEELRREHQDQLAALRALREQELLQRDDEHEAAVLRLGEELAAARSKATQPGPAQVLARHSEAMKALEKRLRDEKDQALVAAATEWKARMERLRRGHADSLAALRREHQDQLLALDAARQEGLAKQPFADQGGKVVPLKAVTRDRSS